MQVQCPTCNTDVQWNNESVYRPFCCKKCQLIDLGEWAHEAKSIPCGANPNEQTTQMPSIEDIEALLAAQPDTFFK